MVREPTGIVDRLLWDEAQVMLGRHGGRDTDGRCAGCGRHWPCPTRRLGERAEHAARRPWQVALSFRHDMNSLRSAATTRTPTH